MLSSYNVKERKLTLTMDPKDYKAFKEGRTSFEVYLPWAERWKSRFVYHREEAMGTTVIVKAKDEEPLEFGICFITWRLVPINKYERAGRHIVLMLRKI